MGKRLSQLNQIEEVKKEDYLLVDSEEYLESKKIKLENVDINSFDTKNFYNEINRIFVKKEQNKGLSSNDFTDKDKNKLDNSQEKLKSGINIKNINGESILGEGNIDIQGGGESSVIIDQFSNSLKSTKSGAVITADDVSPLEHSLKVKLTSDTVTDFSGVSVTRKGMNFFNPAENFDASYKDYVSLDDDVFTMSTPQAQLYINTDKTVVTPAGKYTITLFPLEDYSDFNVFVYFYNKDGGETSVSTGTIGTAFGTYSYTFTAYEDFILSIGGAYGHLYSGERKFRVMLEEGAVDNSKYSVFVEPQTVATNKYGTVEGLTSASPMTLYSDNDEVIIHCEYNKDINSLVDQVYNPESENAQSGKAVAEAIKQTNNIFANALKGTKSGSAISVNDVSVVEHSLGVSVKRKNLLPFPYQQGTNTQSGGTATVNSDGTITFSGIPTAYMGIVLYNGEAIVKNGIYTLSIGKETQNVSATIFLYDSEGNTVLQKGFTNNITINADEYPTVTKWNITLSRSASNKEMSGTAYPQLELGTTATEYTPYVADVNGVEVSRYGKNLLPYPYYNTTRTINGITYTINEDRSVTANGIATDISDFYFFLDNNNMLKLKDKQITFSGCPTGGSITTYYLALSGNNTYIDIGSGKSQLMLHDCHAFYIRIARGVTVNNIVFKPQIELGTTATEYEPYKEPQTANANADGTVEGLTSLSPNMTLVSDTEGVNIVCEYNRDINSFKGGGNVEVDQVYDPVSSNAQSGKAVADALNTLNTSLDNKINTLSSAALRREILQSEDPEYINSDEFLSTAETNVIYMVPSNINDPMNCTYKEYMVFKDVPSVEDSGTDYIYAKADGWVPGEGEPPIDIQLLYSLYLRDATVEYVDSYDRDDGRPVHRTLKLSGYSLISGSIEEHIITVSYWDTGELWSSFLPVFNEERSYKFNIGFGYIEFESVPEDNEMYALGYNVRSRFSYEATSLKNRVELIGSTDIDLTNYPTKTEVNTAITTKIDTTYKSTSTNAQSGKAVAEAIKNIPLPNTLLREQEIDGTIFMPAVEVEAVGGYSRVRVYDELSGNIPIVGVDTIEDVDTSAVCVGFLNEKLGAIETTLDSIIAIQNELIGGNA